jgi:L-ribulokinase
VHPYANGVIDEKLPGTDIRLEPDWALQDPNDYIEVFKQAIPAVLKKSGVDPADVIGLGIDFTACTMLPTKADGTPLCFFARISQSSACLGETVETPCRPAGSQQAQ